MSKTALITGVTGQDGSFLSELLLEKGYKVYGMLRRSSLPNLQRLENVVGMKNFELLQGDLGDASSLNYLVKTLKPHEIYNLAAQSHVKISFEVPEYTSDVTGVGALRLLEAIRDSGIKTRFYQASSSELFGRAPAPQDEKTPFQPVSPYAVAKLFAYWNTVNYRQSYGMYACNGILFNHESERRGENFVTRKITRAVARIKKGLQKELVLGNIDSRRDWGYAKDYVEAMWLMLQQSKPDDYVIATGKTYSVKQFLVEAFGYVGLDYRKHVRIDERFYRPIEVRHLLGNPAKARKRLGWKPRTSFKQLVQIMMDSDMRLAEKESR